MSGRFPGNPWSITNRSGTIAAGGVAQELLAANSQRRGFYVQNVSSGDMWVSTFGTASADQPSLRLAAGSMLEIGFLPGTTPTGAISVFGATTGQAYTAAEW